TSTTFFALGVVCAKAVPDSELAAVAAVKRTKVRLSIAPSPQWLPIGGVADRLPDRGRFVATDGRGRWLVDSRRPSAAVVGLGHPWGSPGEAPGPSGVGLALPLGRRESVVHVVERDEPEGAVPVLGVVPGEEALAERFGSSGEPNRVEKLGRYLS